MESESVRIMRQRVADLQEQLDRMRAEIARLEFELKQAEAAIKYMTSITPTGARASRNALAHYARKASPAAARLTIKELVLKALHEHLWNGATSQQLLEVFFREWGRDDVVRTSLSPQLTRLKDEGKITLEGKLWFLAEDYYEDPDLARDAFLEAQAEAQNEIGEAEASPDAEGVGAPSTEEDKADEGRDLL